MTVLAVQRRESDRESLVESLREAITTHISGLALDEPDVGKTRTKAAVRLSHGSHRRDVFAKERLRLQPEWRRLSEWFAVGAVPPYSGLLGGKLVASLMASDEVSADFERRYSNTTGIISKEPKAAHLAMITVTSALGRSSLYNRLSLPGLVKLQRLGNTEGWGHFHVPDPVFADMRRLLEMDGHRYAAGYRYGQGPNWRLRVIRESLGRLGMSPAILRHGINREVFAMPLATDWRPYLLGEIDTPGIRHATMASLSDAAMSRWVLPRAERCPEALSWTAEDRVALFQPMFQSPPHPFGSVR